MICNGRDCDEERCRCGECNDFYDERNDLLEREQEVTLKLEDTLTASQMRLVWELVSLNIDLEQYSNQ